jgi:hypothetical protein
VIFGNEELVRHILQGVLAKETLLEIILLRFAAVGRWRRRQLDAVDEFVQELLDLAFVPPLADDTQLRAVGREHLRRIGAVFAESSVMPSVSLRACRVEDVHRFWCDLETREQPLRGVAQKGCERKCDLWRHVVLPRLQKFDRGVNPLEPRGAGPQIGARPIKRGENGFGTVAEYVREAVVEGLLSSQTSSA